MFSKACEYSIRAVVYIWSQSKDGKTVALKDICKATDVPEYFTAKMLQNLSRLGMISSVKGPNGGFYIKKEQEDLRLIEVVAAVDGDNIFKGCGLGLKVCSEINPCPIHDGFKSIRDQLKSMLSETYIKDLASELHDGKVFLKRVV